MIPGGVSDHIPVFEWHLGTLGEKSLLAGCAAMELTFEPFSEKTTSTQRTHHGPALFLPGSARRMEWKVWHLAGLPYSLRCYSGEAPASVPIIDGV
jgi:hypothetical protein